MTTITMFAPVPQCPRCGIRHDASHAQRKRLDVLCEDCQPLGPAWRQNARREINRLNREAS